MKKLIILIMFCIFTLSFSSQYREDILKLVKKMENSKYIDDNEFEEVFIFLMTDEDVEVELRPDITGNEEDKVDANSKQALLRSYILGALKLQLESKKKLTTEEIDKYGMEAALKTYKELKKSNKIDIKLYEDIIR